MKKIEKHEYRNRNEWNKLIVTDGTALHYKFVTHQGKEEWRRSIYAILKVNNLKFLSSVL